MRLINFPLIILLCLISLTSSHGQKLIPTTEGLGIAMESYPYPYPVEFLELQIQNQPVKMAFMDIKPEKANGKVVMLLHGKNFFGAYWKETIAFLSTHGYRVIVPDLPGFGKSSKPNLQYSFHMLASQARNLMNHLQIDRVAVLGHSMGGMVATRFALMFSENTSHLILENPIGLEDYSKKVPYVSVEEHYKDALQQTEEKIRNYHKQYYATWKDAYEQYVQVHAQWLKSGEYPRLAWASALTSDMIFTQPVVYEFIRIKVPTLLVIGQLDKTALGKNKVPDDVAESMGNYKSLGIKAAATIPGATLVELDKVGHIPHFEAPEKFHQTILQFLR